VLTDTTIVEGLTMDEETMALIKAMQAMNLRISNEAAKVLAGQIDPATLHELGGLLILLGDLMKAHADKSSAM
jgi:hypothetical protein